MCGVLAIIGAAAGACSAPVMEGRWSRALERLRRRGPDGSGDWLSPDQRVRLGHTRLAVVDLSQAGAQPMANEDGAIRITCNGEIYNAPALRRELLALGHRFASGSDTEVIIHGYEQWGSRGVLDRLRGMFAFVLWDNRAGSMLACVDHVGMKPLCFARVGGSWALASTADALVELLGDTPALDATSLCHVLCHGYIPGRGTVWNGVTRLCPGEAMEWTPGRGEPHVWRWWEPSRNTAAAPTPPEAFESIWTHVVREHLNSDVPVRLLLSGGLDSTALAVALAESGAHADCITLALEGASDESHAAAETARFLGLGHAVQKLGAADIEQSISEAADAFDEPQGYGALLTMTRVSQAARRGGKVVLAGDGGDEAFAGYSWHRGWAPVGPVDAAHPSLARQVASAQAGADVRWRALSALSTLSFAHAHAQRVAPRMHPAEAQALLAPLGASYDHADYVRPLAHHDAPDLPALRRAQRLDLLTFCAGSILPKVDRASMSVGLEVRAPFLDRRVLEWALALPVAPEEMAPESSKPVLRRYLAGRAPDGVLRRPKQGFSLRTGGPAVYDAMLTRVRESSLARDGYLCDQWESFVAPDVPYREQRIFTLAMISAWLERRVPCASRS